MKICGAGLYLDNDVAAHYTPMISDWSERLLISGQGEPGLREAFFHLWEWKFVWVLYNNVKIVQMTEVLIYV